MSTFWRYILVSLSASIVLVFAAAFSLPDNRLHLVFCDIGQGDAILIYRGQTQILIDGGPDRSVLSCLSRHMPFWDRKIELIVLTNPDLDHYEGFIDVLRRYDVGLFTSPGIIKDDQGFKALLDVIKRNHVSNRVTTAGESLKVGGINLYALWPTRDYLSERQDYFSGDLNTFNPKEDISGKSSESVNKWSLVFKLSYGEFKALLTGDIVPPATDLSIEDLDTSVEVLKVPHHGSKNGLTQGMLDKAKPKLAVISVGKKNRYGHPNKETLDILQKNKIKTLRTDLDGEVEVITDGKSWGLWGR